jgi:hypothetical protein
MAGRKLLHESHFLPAVLLHAGSYSGAGTSLVGTKRGRVDIHLP